MISVGLDVHLRNSFVHARTTDGQTLAKGRCGHDLASLAERLGPAETLARASGQAVRCVLEATTHSRAVALLLERDCPEAGIDLCVDVLDARQLRVIAQSVSKCDRLDAEILAELGACGLRLPRVYVPDDEVFALREHLRARADLVRLSIPMHRDSRTACTPCCTGG
jgi:hypothetical protein